MRGINDMSLRSGSTQQPIADSTLGDRQSDVVGNRSDGGAPVLHEPDVLRIRQANGELPRSFKHAKGICKNWSLWTEPWISLQVDLPRFSQQDGQRSLGVKK